MCVSICVPGVLKDKADLQRGWGVEPRGEDVSARERLRRFYYVYNRDKVCLGVSSVLGCITYFCSATVHVSRPGVWTCLDVLEFVRVFSLLGYCVFRQGRGVLEAYLCVCVCVFFCSFAIIKTNLC